MHPAARLILLLAVISSLSAAVTADFVNSTCSAAGNYTDNSPYGQNVAELRSALATPPPATPGNHWWYRSRTVGQVRPVDEGVQTERPNKAFKNLRPPNYMYSSSLAQPSRCRMAARVSPAPAAVS
ncbi:unnamed protein product [Urochloa humidicola]